MTLIMHISYATPENVRAFVALRPELTFYIESQWEEGWTPSGQSRHVYLIGE